MISGHIDNIEMGDMDRTDSLSNEGVTTGQYNVKGLITNFVTGLRLAKVR